MSIFSELDPMQEQRTQLDYKCKQKNIFNVNIPDLALPNQHTDIEIPHSLIDLVTVPDTIKITFNLDFESTGKTCSIVHNVVRALLKKKLLILGSKEIYSINNTNF